jgi:hypothetical protein
MEWPEPNVAEARLLAGVQSIAPSSFLETGLVLPARSGKFTLIPAADSGPNWSYTSLAVSVLPGQYRILTAETRTHGFWLRVHALANDA